MKDYGYQDDLGDYRDDTGGAGEEDEGGEPRRGAFAKLGQMLEVDVDPDELMDLLGPDEGYSDYGAAPEFGMEPTLGTAEAAGPAGPETGVYGNVGAAGGLPDYDSGELQEPDKNDMRDMLALRAQERLAASEAFQNKAYAMTHGKGRK